MIQIFLSERIEEEEDDESVKFFYIINENYYKCIYSWIHYSDISNGHISEWTTLKNLREIASSQPCETISKEKALDLIRKAHVLNKIAYDNGCELYEKVQEALLVF